MARFLGRPYLAAAGLGLVSTAAAAALLPLARAAALFESRPIPANQVVALAQPLAGNRWGLVLLEQRQSAVPCWQPLADGTVLNMADGVRNETYCGRYSSSGAYSLRVADNDLSRPWQLKLETRSGQLELQATSPQTTSPIVVAQAPLPGRALATNSLVALELQAGWGLERRSYEGRLLSHIYLSNREPLPLLLARARSSEPQLAAPTTPPPAPVASRSERPRFTSPRPLAMASDAATGTDSRPGEVVALQVVPFRD